MSTAVITPEMGALKARLRATWMDGDYDRFSRFMESDARAFYRRLNVPPGARLLDVACGSGQVALMAARSGAAVTGCDIAPNWVERARERAAAEGLKAAFDEADAEALPYSDASFDVVTSLFGAMFAPRPGLVAAELLRVCRPGATIAMGNWTGEGFVGKMLGVIARHIAPPGVPSPLLWGDEETVRTRLGAGCASLALVRRMCRFEYPMPPADVVELFRNLYGPMSRAFAALDENGRGLLRKDLARLWSTHNRAGNGDTSVEAEYLEVAAIRA